MKESQSVRMSHCLDGTAAVDERIRAAVMDKRDTIAAMDESDGIVGMEEMDGEYFGEIESGGDGVYVGAVLVGKAWECPFRDLCEKLYPEPEMRAYRERCNRDYTAYCCHYWGFHDGYHDLDDE